MEDSWFNNQKTVGVLGGGQLGRMLIQKAVDMNITVSVLDPDSKAPCSEIAHKFTCGSFKDYDAVYKFGKTVDLLTVEIEHVNIEALEKLEKEGLKIFPQPSILKMVQDKGTQKSFYRDSEVPTSPFTIVESAEMIVNTDVSYPVFQKLRKFGYDGRGVQKLNAAGDISRAFDEPSVLESAVDFAKELSVIVARNESGEVAYYPPVEMEFNDQVNLVEYISSPANVGEDIYHKATTIAVKLIDKLKLCGILAVEMFLTKDGEILVNEIAPRPHNSGHHTIEGNVTSQYEQHLRAILNMPLGSTEVVLPAVTVNVLGAEGHTGPAKYAGLEKVLGLEGAHIHLYGKFTTKPFRKMGHVTVTDENPEHARVKANFIKENLSVIT